MIETKSWPVPPAVLPVYPYSKWNVWRWFGNVEGLDDGYRPELPLWRRKFFWFFRNFAYNFFRFVVGTEDRVIEVTGTAPLFITFRFEETPPSLGWKWSVIKIGLLRLPFVSYCSSHITWYVGWLPSGGRLGAKFNLV